MKFLSSSTFFFAAFAYLDIDIVKFCINKYWKKNCVLPGLSSPLLAVLGLTELDVNVREQRAQTTCHSKRRNISISRSGFTVCYFAWEICLKLWTSFSKLSSFVISWRFSFSRQRLSVTLSRWRADKMTTTAETRWPVKTSRQNLVNHLIALRSGVFCSLVFEVGPIHDDDTGRWGEFCDEKNKRKFQLSSSPAAWRCCSSD